MALKWLTDGVAGVIRAGLEAYTAWKKGKGPAAAEAFEKEAEKADGRQANRRRRADERDRARDKLLDVELPDRNR